MHKDAGKLPEASSLVDIPKLITAYYAEIPDPSLIEQMISFGTSGHRGSPFQNSFNENHILAITQAICLYREKEGINGPLFLGSDTHALSFPALVSALEVLAANGVMVMLAKDDAYTPTPVISHAILTHNAGKKDFLSDGIVITPSHNPPEEGGFKYNPPNGGPADVIITQWIENKANEILKKGLVEVKRISFQKAVLASTTKRFDYITHYVDDLKNVIDMQVIKASNISLGVDPLGGAGLQFWEAIKEKYGINLTIVNTTIDPTFRFMTLDWDGKIRMDPSSPYVMKGLIAIKDRFDVSFSCDTDHDRHGIVTKGMGLLPSSVYQSSAIDYLFRHRPCWNKTSGVGKSIVSSSMIDRVTKSLGRSLYEVPVGFKWFVEGLLSGALAFGGEESAGASFLRMNGKAWSTDKDGIILSLLSAEMTAKTGIDPGEYYTNLSKQFGTPYFERFEGKATRSEKKILKGLKPADVTLTTLGGEKIEQILTEAPGNHAPIGGLKVQTKNCWFAVRPSGTEDIYKIYVESFLGKEHVKEVLKEAESVVDNVLSVVQA